MNLLTLNSSPSPPSFPASPSNAESKLETLIRQWEDKNNYPYPSIPLAEGDYHYVGWDNSTPCSLHKKHKPKKWKSSSPDFYAAGSPVSLCSVYDHRPPSYNESWGDSVVSTPGLRLRTFGSTLASSTLELGWEMHPDSLYRLFSHTMEFFPKASDDDKAKILLFLCSFPLDLQLLVC